MDTAEIEKANIRNTNRSLAVGTLALAFFSHILTYVGIFPWSPGNLHTIAALINSLLSFLFPTTRLSVHSVSIGLAFAPFWILILDPCALPFAQMMSMISIVSTAVEHRKNSIRVFYTALLLLSWCLVFVSKGTLIHECQENTSTYLRRDAIMIMLLSLHTAITCHVQTDSLLKATKEALAQIRELNSKNESLNTELKQLLEDKDNFILLFSHETRNPLNILLGNLALLLDEVEDPRAKTRLNRCKFCADLLLQHLNNILDTGKLASRGALEVTPTPVRVYEYLQPISNFMEMLIKKKSSLKPELLIPQKLPTTLKFDMQRLTQVILNLLTNAVKFTDAGSITMVVRYLKKDHIEEADYYPTTAFGYLLLNRPESQEDESSSAASEFGENPIGSDVQINTHFRREIDSLEEKKKKSIIEDIGSNGFLKIEINDTGCGMKEEDLKKLFQKFSQTHSEGSQRQIGSGLGLWITKALCELMNGGIRVYSKTKIGTCFTVIIQAESLPLQARSLSKPETLSTPTLPKSCFKSRKRVLLADDDPYNLDLHVHILNELGYSKIETVSDGQQMLDKFKSNPEKYFEFIISDVSMPRLDGVQAALEIREFELSEKRNHHVKIGFITGHSNLIDKARCEKDPISAIFYLPKPIKAIMLESFLCNSKNAAPQQKQIEREISIPKKKTDMMQEASPLVLCVDDDIFNLDCLTEMLESLKVKAIKATSGEESLDLFKSIVFKEEKNLSLVLMDCRMSGMDGWTACHRMKEMLRAGKKADIRIIGLTGEDKERNIEKFRESGMDELIQKPATREKLQKLLGN